MKLVGGGGAYENRSHFLAVASRAMRHLLISYAQRQASQKRGSGAADLPLDEALLIPHQRSEELLALDEALDRLKEADRSEEHTSELQSLMRISYAVFCLKKKKHSIYSIQRHYL